MKASVPAWCCSLFPVGVVTVCTVLSMSGGQVEVCNPFWSGCTSISAAARQEPSIHLFRMVMLPLTPVIAAFWGIGRWWLLRGGCPRRTANAIAALGWVGAFFLILYVVFLGTHGPVYGLLRRFGTTTFFGGTGVAQLWLTARIHRDRPDLPAVFTHAMIWVGAAMLLVGVSYLPAAELLDNSRIENRLEWAFALLMQVHFGLTAAVWSREGLRIGLR